MRLRCFKGKPLVPLFPLRLLSDRIMISTAGDAVQLLQSTARTAEFISVKLTRAKKHAPNWHDS